MTNIQFYRLDETGVYVIEAGSARTLPEGAIALPDGVSANSVLKHYLVNGELTPRPLAPKPTQTETGWIVEGCPEGTVVEIIDTIGNEIMAEVLTTAAEPDVVFNLADAGSYQVVVNTPDPYVDTYLNIEVENA